MLPVPGLPRPRRRRRRRAASYVNAPTYPNSPPYPGAGTGPYPHQPAPFPGWGAPPAGRSGPPTRMTPVASPRTGTAAGPPWELPGQTGPQPPAAGADDEANGLPRRVKQASLAPQLRDNPPGRTSAGGDGLRGERADAGGTPQDHGGAPARLAGGPVAADEHPGPG